VKIADAASPCSDLRAWACAVIVSGVQPFELTGGIRGSVVMPYCTRSEHDRGRSMEHCGCARGTARRYQTNHSRHSSSRAFGLIRRALGAVPWQEGGDIEVVR
jgi:hypothetical protein